MRYFYPFSPPVYRPQPMRYVEPYYPVFPYSKSYNYYANYYRGSWTPLSWVEQYNYAFSGPANSANVALTFDDGPDATFTPQILDKLKKYGVKATFFLLGENMEKYPDLVRRIVAEGHVIGNHTYSHPNITTLSDQEFVAEMKKTDDLIFKMAGYRPRFFRPTYGAIDENKLRWATNQNMMVIQWTIDTLDWEGRSAEQINQMVNGNILPGSIILQHNADGVPLQGSVDSLDLFIPALLQKGTRFVTLPQMFGLPKDR